MAVDTPVVPAPPAASPARRFQFQAVAQFILLVAGVAVWVYSVILLYSYHVADAQVIAYGGWAAVLALIRIDFGLGTPPQGP